MVKLEQSPPNSPPNRRVFPDGRFNNRLINQVVHEYPPLRRPRYMPDIVQIHRLRLQSDVQSAVNELVRIYVNNLGAFTDEDNQEILQEARSLILRIEEKVTRHYTRRHRG